MSMGLGVVQENVAPESVLAEVQAAWEHSVGAAIAGHSHPVAERDGVLDVVCSSSVWAQELELLSGELIEGINANLARRKITQIRCLIDLGGRPP